MASIRERSASDGTTRWAVLWREHGRQTSYTFLDAKWAATFRLYLEAEGSASAFAWLERQDTTTVDEPQFVTLDQWMSNYITHLTSVTEGTRDEYRRMYDRTFSPLLGPMPAAAITRDRASAAVLGLARRLSHKSIRNALSLVSAGMAAAVTDPATEVESNPFRRVRLPAGGDLDDEDDGQMTCLTHDEFALLYTEIPAYWKPLIYTLVGTGMRWGEATALRVGDLELDHGRIRIRRAWKRIPGGWEVGPPKSKAGRRTITVPPKVIAVLEEQTKGRRRDQLVFHARRYPDVQVHPNNFRSRVWYPAIGRARRCHKHSKAADPCGCVGTLARSPRLHDLRHTMVAWWIAQGVQLTTIQRQVGHESITTTVGVYGDLLPEVIRQASAAADAALEGLDV